MRWLVYNVVGGVVGMMSFISGTLTTSSQRFFSIEIAKGNQSNLKRIYSLNLTVFVILMLIALLIAETLGLWFVNTQMMIPDDRIFSANVVYQISLATFALHLIAIPFNALIVSYEKMNIYAYISIADAFLKLFAVILLQYIGGDRLIWYGFFMLFVSLCGVGFNVIYCLANYKESRYSFYWDKNEVKTLFSFSGWHFLGTIASVVRSNGINVLINMFFNPAVNAARAIAFQVNGAVTQLSNNFFTAVKPQIYKSYGAGELEQMRILVLRSTVMCVFLVSVLCLPLLVTTEGVLSLWLHDVPDYAVFFTQLALVTSLVDSAAGPSFASVLATGRIKKFYITVASLYLLVLPLSYIALKAGCQAWVTMAIDIILALINTFVRAWFLIKLIGLSFRNYSQLIIKMLFSTIFIFIIIYYIATSINGFWMSLLLTVIVSSILHIIVYWIIVLDEKDKKMINSYVLKVINR